MLSSLSVYDLSSDDHTSRCFKEDDFFGGREPLEPVCGGATLESNGVTRATVERHFRTLKRRLDDDLTGPWPIGFELLNDDTRSTGYM